MTDAQRVILASGSATRASLLTAAGVEFHVEHPRVDEAAVKSALMRDGARPRDVADALAELKAQKVSQRRPGLVIGSDQTLDLDGALFDKPQDLIVAREQLLALRGRTHALHAAVVIARDGHPIWREVKTARLALRPFSEAFLDDYIAREGDALLHTVGGYRIEGLGLQLFSRVEGDGSTIMGMPLLGLLEFLRVQGVLAS